MNVYNENIDVRLDVNARAKEDFDRVWLVKNEDGSNYDFTGHTVTWEWFRNQGVDTPDLTFNAADGLVLAPGEIRLSKDAAKMSIPAREYLHFLRVVDGSGKKRTWLNGVVPLNNGLFNGNPGLQPTLTINPNGTPLTIQIIHGKMSGAEIINSLTDADIEELYLLLYPYIIGEVLPGGPSDYIGTLYLRLKPFIEGEQ